MQIYLVALTKILLLGSLVIFPVFWWIWIFLLLFQVLLFSANQGGSQCGGFFVIIFLISIRLIVVWDMVLLTVGALNIIFSNIVKTFLVVSQKVDKPK